jgi:small subunit ribosomal protein S6
MPVNVYECMFLLDTNKVAGDLQGATAQLHAILERGQAEILASRPWDERRLAYPIGNQKKGLYYLTYFKAEAKNLLNIERDVSLNETILRSLVLKVAPQLVETMLELARDENALVALPAGKDDSADLAGVGDSRGDYRGGGDDRGPRRGGRRPADDDDKG